MPHCGPESMSSQRKHHSCKAVQWHILNPINNKKHCKSEKLSWHHNILFFVFLYIVFVCIFISFSSFCSFVKQATQIFLQSDMDIWLGITSYMETWCCLHSIVSPHLGDEKVMSRWKHLIFNLVFFIWSHFSWLIQFICFSFCSCCNLIILLFVFIIWGRGKQKPKWWGE